MLKISMTLQIALAAETHLTEGLAFRINSEQYLIIVVGVRTYANRIKCGSATNFVPEILIGIWYLNTVAWN
jgi:hypothetical protein